MSCCLNKDMQTMINIGSKLLCFIITILLLTPSFKVLAQDIKPFVAQYDLFRQGEKYGSGTRTLIKENGDVYSLQLKSNIEWLIFSDNRLEKSEFIYKNGDIKPLSYYFERTGTGSDKKLMVFFNEDKTLTVGPNRKKTKLPDNWEDGWLDEMTLHLRVQQDLIQGKDKFEYTIISSGGKIREYHMEVIGHEIISTGLGRHDAIKVARIYDKPDHTSLHAWFIPEFNHTLVRMWRIKKGVEQYDLVISNYAPLEIATPTN